jgi:hypothetical protein
MELNPGEKTPDASRVEIIGINAVTTSRITGAK